MRRFELLEPTSLDEACALLAEGEDRRPIAGGTALLVLIKLGLYIPTKLVNLKKVGGASEISYTSERGLRLGAPANIHDLLGPAEVREPYPLLTEARHLVRH